MAEDLLWRTAWLPGLGIDLAFRLDGLALLFLLLITGVGSLVVLYALEYLRTHPQRPRFIALMLSFMAAMMGLVLADDIIAMFVFWELTSLTSFMLIGFKHDKPESRRSARQALLVTGVGGLALLAGLILLGNAAGTFVLSEIATRGELVRADPLYPAIFGLVALGALTKSAQFPFHFWLPNAMAAPTPVSAYLHSATMVKAGIYLLMRMDPVLGGTALWTVTLSAAGGITMLLGAVWALAQTDLKKLLAYTTLTALGTLTLLIGLSFETSIQAAVVFLVVHALYKGALFLVAGSVEHATGTRDLRELGTGLRRDMPKTFVAAVVAGLSMAGLPPLFGFIGKELAYEAKLGFVGADILLPVAAILANALTVAAAARLVLGAFGGKPGAANLRRDRKVVDVPARMLVGPAVLGSAGVVLGIDPELISPLLSRAASTIAGHDVTVELALWHGPNLALLMSAVTLAAGALAYTMRRRIQASLERVGAVVGGTGDRAYDGAMSSLDRLARATADAAERPALRHHILVIVALATGLAAWPLLADVPTVVVPAGAEVGLVPIVLAVVATVAAIAAAVAREKLAIITSLGVVGFAVALLLLSLGAPDLAITQLLVETLIVVVALLALRRARGILDEGPTSRWIPLRDGLVAAGAGTVVVAIVWWAASLGVEHSAAEYFAAESVPGGHGRNIVNVILVDFRALDTLGEIAVVAAAGLGIHGLARRRSRRAAEGGAS